MLPVSGLGAWSSRTVVLYGPCYAYAFYDSHRKSDDMVERYVLACAPRYRTLNWSRYGASRLKRGGADGLVRSRHSLARGAFGLARATADLLRCGDPARPDDQGTVSISRTGSTRRLPAEGTPAAREIRDVCSRVESLGSVSSVNRSDLYQVSAAGPRDPVPTRSRVSKAAGTRPAEMSFRGYPRTRTRRSARCREFRKAMFARGARRTNIYGAVLPPEGP